MDSSIFFGRVASLRFETQKVEAKEGVQAVEPEIIYLTCDDIDFEQMYKLIVLDEAY